MIWGFHGLSAKYLTILNNSIAHSKVFFRDSHMYVLTLPSRFITLQMLTFPKAKTAAKKISDR